MSKGVSDTVDKTQLASCSNNNTAPNSLFPKLYLNSVPLTKTKSVSSDSFSTTSNQQNSRHSQTLHPHTDHLDSMINTDQHFAAKIPEPRNLGFTSMDDLVNEAGLEDSTKLKYYNRALISYLSSQGLNINPLKLTSRHLKEKPSIQNFLNSNETPGSPINSSLSSNPVMETFLTGNGQILFLPFNPQKKRRRRNNIRDEYNDEDEDHDNDNDHNNENENDDGNGNANNENIDGENDNGNRSANVKTNTNTSLPLGTDRYLHSPTLKNSPMNSNAPNLNPLNGDQIANNMASNSDLGNNPNITYHTFGVIIKLKKSCNLNQTIKVNYHTHASVRWVAPEYSKKPSFDERYRTSKTIEWDLDFSNPDCYIPLKEPIFHSDMADHPDSLNTSTESDSLSLDSMNNSKNKIDIKYSTQPTQSIKNFSPLNPNEYISESRLLKNDTLIESNLFKEIDDPNNSRTFEPGYYIFLLPVVYPLNTPESVIIPNASLSHDFSIQIQKGQVTLPTLQAPQSAFLSTSPSHHYKYDDQNFEFHNNQSNLINSSPNNTSGTKSSFFKKIGIRKSSFSNKADSTSQKSTSNVSSSIDKQHGNNSHHNSHLSNIFSKAPTTYNFNYKLPVIRLPPSDATSTLNKSIYVNKVWNKSLNYELLLPRKFTQLSPPNNMAISKNDKFLHNNTFTLQMKLVPLVKNLQLKRIKINIVERITYVSGLSANSKDAEETKSARSRTKERIVTMMEIKTKEKQNQQNVNISNPLHPLKTHIIKGCTNDNLLTFCYDDENPPPKSSSRSRSNSTTFKASSSFMSGSRKMSRLLDSSLSHSHNHQETSNNVVNNKKGDVTITNPVKLQCPLNFVAYDEYKFISNTYDNLCTGTSALNGLNDEMDSFDKNVDSMSIFSVNSNNNDGSNAFVDDDLGLSKSPVRRARNFSFSSNTTTSNNTHTINNNNNSHNWNSNQLDDKSNSHSFLPDVTFSNLKIRHRLQISFRISRPDEKIKNTDGTAKLHHYEVIVDTPIVFVSPFCVNEALDLPSYDDAVKIGMFEVNKNSSKFAMTKLGADDEVCSSGYDSNDDMLFAPCSPLMSGTLPSMINRSNYHDTNSSINNRLSLNNPESEQTTNILGSSITSSPSSLPKYEVNDSCMNRRRSNSGYSLLAPGNATSLLSAAFSRSKDRSNSLHSLLANDMSSLSLNSAIPHVNNIDNVIGSPSNAAPPLYSEIASKISSESGEGSQNMATSEALPAKAAAGPPTYDKAVKEEEMPLPEITPNSSPSSSENRRGSAIKHSDSKTSLDSEKMGLLENDTRFGLSNSKTVSRLSLTKSNRRNSVVESEISFGNSINLDGAGDIDSIINMSMNAIPTLNLTPTQNGT